MDQTLKESEAIGNLVIQTKTDTVDILLSLITLGFYRTQEIIVTGDHVRFVQPKDKQSLSPDKTP